MGREEVEEEVVVEVSQNVWFYTVLSVISVYEHSYANTSQELLEKALQEAQNTHEAKIEEAMQVILLTKLSCWTHLQLLSVLPLFPLQCPHPPSFYLIFPPHLPSLLPPFSSSSGRT